ncbi:tetratricopeptide repeat protein [Microbulbifer sp. SA54]|uniref:tetratricopeptide repeat protein n=1 Tax=Microbulbifer sp. SA54 TaxID=3401577 RepID=UPI003AAF8DD4
MVKILFCAALFVATLLHLPVCDASDWYEYRSDNFTVYSDVPERQVNAMMRDLERFRRAALSFTGIEDFPENQKLRVFHFDDSSEFRAFSGDEKIAGFYRESWRGPVIFSRQQGHGISGSGLIFHEYVHHLMREHSGMTYPKWYSEGFAELLASAELRKDTVVIGGVPEWRLTAWANPENEPLTIAQLLVPRPMVAGGGDESSAYWNNFYASAWLFTHYLQLGRFAGNPDYHGATGDYLRAVAGGEDPLEVFEDYFGKSAAEMQRQILGYMQGDIYAHRLDIPEYRYSIPRRLLNENERLFVLADEAQDFGKRKLAQAYLDQSEKHGLGWQENLAAMAALKAQDNDFAFGERILEEIGEHGQISHLTAASLARYYLLRLQALALQRQWNEEFYSAAVKYGMLAMQMGPHYLPGYKYLWTAYQQKGKQDAALQVLMSAYQQEPNHLHLNAAIGFYLAHIGKAALAREYLERVVAWSHDDGLRVRAEKFLSTTD